LVFPIVLQGVPSILKEAPMHKKITKMAAFVALFACLMLLAPTLSNARTRKVDIRYLLQRPAYWISSFWNIITPIFDGRDNSPAAIVSPAKMKPLTDSLSPKLSKGD
jgi:hypothetical protein